MQWANNPNERAKPQLASTFRKKDRHCKDIWLYEINIRINQFSRVKINVTQFLE